VGEGVEACSEKDVLCDALGNGAGERVFGVAAAGDEERAKGNRERTVRTRGRAAKLFTISIAENGDGDRVVEDEGRSIVELVRGAAQGHAKCGS
jgi:hypothetical protein